MQLPPLMVKVPWVMLVLSVLMVPVSLKDWLFTGLLVKLKAPAVVTVPVKGTTSVWVLKQLVLATCMVPVTFPAESPVSRPPIMKIVLLTCEGAVKL